MTLTALRPASAGETLIIQGGHNIGEIIWTFRHLAPSNAVALVGALLLIADYPALWSQVASLANVNGDNWVDLYGGTGDTGVPATDTFGTPDLRGEFLRVADGGRGTPAKELGEWQGSANLSHSHSYVYPYYGQSIDYPGGYSRTLISSTSTSPSGGSEARPRAYHLNAFMVFELLP